MKKIAQRFNQGFYLYYGIAGLVATLMGLIGLGRWLYNVFTSLTEFHWGTFVGLLIACTFLGSTTYIILRIGYEQYRK
jgi:hypothetical protein